MVEITPPASSKFLTGGIARGGFETDDVLCGAFTAHETGARAAHDSGLVAPLEGITDLVLADQGFLKFRPGKGSPTDKEHAPARGIAVALERRDGGRRRVATHVRHRSTRLVTDLRSEHRGRRRDRHEAGLSAGLSVLGARDWASR